MAKIKVKGYTKKNGTKVKGYTKNKVKLRPKVKKALTT